MQAAAMIGLARPLPSMQRGSQRREARGDAGEADLAASTLDALAIPMIICDAQGRLVFANRAAEDLARGTQSLRLRPGGHPIGVPVAAEARRLLALIGHAASGGAGGVIQISDGERDAALVAVVSPLRLRFAPERPSGRALIALRWLRETPAFTASMLASLYGLSPSQAAIALMLFQGMTAEAIAAARGVKISTVRTHLSEIYLRTGADTQIDLIRRLATLPPLRR